MHRSLVASLLLFFAWASASSAAPLHLLCHDGDPQVVRKGVGLIDWATCDSLVDGVCTFRIPKPLDSLCNCPFVGCCGSGEFSVPVKGKKRVLLPGRGRLILRCMPTLRVRPGSFAPEPIRPLHAP